MGISVTKQRLVNTTNQIYQRNQSDRNVGIRRREKVGSATNRPTTSDLTVDVGGQRMSEAVDVGTCRSYDERRWLRLTEKIERSTWWQRTNIFATSAGDIEGRVLGG
ncbi:unnamed protein product [Citrullus colocynthis]|uniref:Uncharacterized protein n=1 Tax=Citrullus colocynthis TaxID=252529 RepID=A0ABP0Y029_9ROSI